MKEIVPCTEGISLVVLLVVGNTLVFALGGLAGADIWLAFIVATVLALPLVIIYARMRFLMGDRNLSEGLAYLFGKWPSRFVALAYSFYAWRLSCLVVGDVTTFIQAVALPTTPQIVLALCFIALSIWAVKEGVEVIARWSMVMGKLFFSVLFFAFLLLLTEVELGEFLPVLYNGFKPVMLGALQILDFPFLETVLLFWTFERFSKKDSPYRVFIPGFLIAAFIMLLLTSTSMSVLGAHRYSVYYFPIYTAVARVDAGVFLTRLEAIVSTTFAVGSFLKIAVCILVASRALVHGLGFSDYRFVVTPLALSTIPGAEWFAPNLMQIELSATKAVSPSALTFQAIIPIILWIVAEFRTRKQGKTSSSGRKAS